MSKSNEVVKFTALGVVKGKGVTAAHKLAQHQANGASLGSLVGAGVQRKAIIDALAGDAFAKDAHALSTGNIRPCAAVIVAKSGRAVSIMEVDGKAPYSEWLRIGATLQGMAQVTNAGKETSAAKALALWTRYTEAAKALRAARHGQQVALTGTEPATEGQTEPATEGQTEPAPL